MLSKATNTLDFPIAVATAVLKTPFQFTCANFEFMVVPIYRYLCLWLNKHIDLKGTALALANSAHRALGLLISKFKPCGGMPFDCFTTLYESLVLLLTSYSAAI